MNAALIPEAVQAALFDAAESALIDEMGNVSIVKFLGGKDEADARAKWVRAIEAFIAPMPVGIFLGARVTGGKPTLSFIGDVTLTIDVAQLQDRREFRNGWRVKMMPGLAPVVVDAVGEAMWGEAWLAAVSEAAGTQSYPVKQRHDAVAGRWAGAMSEQLAEMDRELGGEPNYGWIVRAAPDEAPWPWFVSETHARRAGKALALGSARIGALYEAQMGVSRG